MLGRRSVMVLLGALVTAVSLCAAHAQTDPRMAAAKAKGKVSWYAAIFPDELRLALTERFKAKTGLDVETYVGGTGQVYSRFVSERKAGAHNVDVLTISDTDLVAQLVKQKALVPYSKAPTQSIAASYHDADGYWQAIAFWACSLEYNTRLVKKADLPKSWEDLIDPKWKSKIAINDPARSALGFLLLKAMVAEKGWDWIKKLMENDPLVIAVGPGVDQAVVKGERQLGTTVSAYVSATMKAGGPVGVGLDEALFASLMTTSVVADAPNPEGAQLLVDFLLSKEAGELYAANGWFSPRGDVPGPFGYPSGDKLKVRHATIESPESRQQMLDKFNAIAQAARK